MMEYQNIEVGVETKLLRYHKDLELEQKGFEH